ncbi:hypothetical protein DVH05_002902 [Phytophthora capsici]|nr:hypothetical protein DVH05_002902 [Phytophthora capsici]
MSMEWKVKTKGRKKKGRGEKDTLKQANTAEKTELSWGVFVLSGDRKVLLLKHKERDSFWSFCKGHKNYNKDTSDIATALRELREETGSGLGDQVIRLWMKGETWQDYCKAVRTGNFRATEGDDSSTENFRTFVERYSNAGHRKEVTFFVARVPVASEVDYSESKGEITGCKWMPLDYSRDQVKEETSIPGSKRGENGMYEEDLNLLDAIKQAIRNPVPAD